MALHKYKVLLELYYIFLCPLLHFFDSCYSVTFVSPKFKRCLSLHQINNNTSVYSFHIATDLLCARIHWQCLCLIFLYLSFIIIICQSSSLQCFFFLSSRGKMISEISIFNYLSNPLPYSIFKYLLAWDLFEICSKKIVYRQGCYKIKRA